MITAIRLLTELRQDVRYGLRTLASSPGFTAVAVISLALGIGVATCAFSEMNGFVLRDVPGVSKPGELVTLQPPSSYPNYQRYRQRNDLFSGALAYLAPVPFGISLGWRTERTWGHLVAPSYFATLGVRPALGRVFDEGEEQAGRAPSVVVSYRFWQNNLGSDPNIVGKALRVNGQPCTLIGVAPLAFQGASPMVYGADLWLPISVGERLAPELKDNALERHDLAIFQVVGRLKPGISSARAEAELDAVARQHGDPSRNQNGRRLTLLPGGKMLPVRKQDLPFLTGFMTVLGGMILLIASSNVVNMLLARSLDRSREIAVRLSLGAGRARLVRQLLTESMLVAATAGVLGFLMASWVMRLASHEPLPWAMPLTLYVEPDGRVLLFCLALTAFTGLAFGLVPALRSTRGDLTTALKEGGNVQLGRFRRLSLRNALMLSQIAGSLALLLITGFLVIGHQRISGLDVGFDPSRLYLLSLDPVRDGYTPGQASAFLQKLLDRVKGLPYITAASLADSTPMSAIGKPSVAFSADGLGEKTLHYARRYVVGRDFFDTVGIPILRGRAFRREDEANDSTAVIVSEKLVKECWKGKDPLGQRIDIGNEEVPTFQAGGLPGIGPRALGRTRVLQVVGVAKNVRDGLDLVPADAPALIYLPLRPVDSAQPVLQGVTLVVRAAPGVDAILALRREILHLDEHLTPFNARSMPEQIEQMMFPVKVALWTYGFIGIFGLILASVGLAGLTAYSVTQRRREIGIRMALGARSADVLGLVMKESAVLIAAGTVVGLAGAAAGIRLLSAFMSVIARTAGTSASDPALLVGAPLLLAILALVACYVPARSSMRVDPVVILRQD